MSESLFDSLDEMESDDRSSWQEVPQARFLSWSDAMQQAYCRARAVDSALYEEDPEWAEFFLARSKTYGG